MLQDDLFSKNSQYICVDCFFFLVVYDISSSNMVAC